MAGISLDSIRKSYGDTDVLKGVSLDIADGEFLTLVGPSGCGKSTLLRIIAGLERQEEGNVLIGGRNVNQERASKRDLAMVFQSYALYPHLTVRQNMETPLRLRDLSFVERFPLLGLAVHGRRDKVRRLESLVSEVAASLKIEHLLNRKPGQLSGGQRQRVALGRAMVRKPTAFLMDEPLSNLDAALRVHMRAELAQLHRALGVTFVYVTHDQAEALTMSDRMAVMIDGHILQFGTPDEIYSFPQDKRVAEFIGSPKVNFLTGNIDQTGCVNAYGVPLRRRATNPSGKVYVGIRPEHFELVSTSTEDRHWSFKVTHKENLGSDCFLHGHINDSEHRLVVRVTPENASTISIESEIRLKPRSDRAMLFGENNQRIELQEI